jgi:hypothetical protein
VTFLARSWGRPRRLAPEIARSSSLSPKYRPPFIDLLLGALMHSNALMAAAFDERPQGVAHPVAWVASVLPLARANERGSQVYRDGRPRGGDTAEGRRLSTYPYIYVGIAKTNSDTTVSAVTH